MDVPKGNEAGDDVEQFISEEISDTYDLKLSENQERAAEFGSLMVSLQLVADRMQMWTEEGHLPETDQIEKRQRRILRALKESPVDDLDPDESDFDKKLKDLVDFAKELTVHLKNLRSAREIVNGANERLDSHKQDIELLKES